MDSDSANGKWLWSHISVPLSQKYSTNPIEKQTERICYCFWELSWAAESTGTGATLSSPKGCSGDCERLMCLTSLVPYLWNRLLVTWCQTWQSPCIGSCDIGPRGKLTRADSAKLWNGLILGPGQHIFMVFIYKDLAQHLKERCACCFPFLIHGTTLVFACVFNAYSILFICRA